MERETVSEQIEALRIEALEARRLAETLSDRQSILDLENYAAQLEAEASRLSSRNIRDANEVLPTHRGDSRVAFSISHNTH